MELWSAKVGRQNLYLISRFRVHTGGTCTGLYFLIKAYLLQHIEMALWNIEMAFGTLVSQGRLAGPASGFVLYTDRPYWFGSPADHNIVSPDPHLQICAPPFTAQISIQCLGQQNLAELACCVAPWQKDTLCATADVHLPRPCAGSNVHSCRQRRCILSPSSPGPPTCFLRLSNPVWVLKASRNKGGGPGRGGGGAGTVCILLCQSEERI